MKYTLRAFSIATLALLSSTAAFAQAPAVDVDNISIATGSKSGNYQVAGTEIAARLASSFKSVNLINSDGSRDNLGKLIRGEVTLGFVQGDVGDLYKIENPSSVTTLYPFKKVYDEYVHILCPSSTGWWKLSDLANARKKGTPVKMIVGPKGGGQAETWRAFIQANPDAYASFERLADSVNRTAASKVKDSSDTCMLWVSGLNSGDMKAANSISINTRNRKPALRLITIDDDAIFTLKDSEGRPFYGREQVKAQLPKDDKPGVYDNLIADRSSWYSSADQSVTVATVPAWLYMTTATRDALKDKTGNLVDAIEDALPTIANKMNAAN